MLIRKRTQNEQEVPLRLKAQLCILAILLLMALFMNACSTKPAAVSPAEHLLFGEASTDTTVQTSANVASISNANQPAPIRMPANANADSSATALPDSLMLPAEPVLLTFVQYSY
jgi:hypothetical protein